MKFSIRDINMVRNELIVEKAPSHVTDAFQRLILNAIDRKEDFISIQEKAEIANYIWLILWARSSPSLRKAKEVLAKRREEKEESLRRQGTFGKITSEEASAVPAYTPWRCKL